MKKQSLLSIMLLGFTLGLTISTVTAVVWITTSELILAHIFEGYTAFAHVSTPAGVHNLQILQQSTVAPGLLSFSLVLCILFAIHQAYWVYLPRIIRGAR